MKDRKNLGVIIVIVGVFVALLGAVGFNYINQAGLTPDQFDSLNTVGNLFGYQSYVSTDTQISIWFAKDRIALLIAGAIVAAGGVLVTITAPKEEDQQ